MLMAHAHDAPERGRAGAGSATRPSCWRRRRRPVALLLDPLDLPDGLVVDQPESRPARAAVGTAAGPARPTVRRGPVGGSLAAVPRAPADGRRGRPGGLRPRTSPWRRRRVAPSPPATPTPRCSRASGDGRRRRGGDAPGRRRPPRLPRKLLEREPDVLLAAARRRTDVRVRPRAARRRRRIVVRAVGLFGGHHATPAGKEILGLTASLLATGPRAVIAATVAVPDAAVDRRLHGRAPLERSPPAPVPPRRCDEPARRTRSSAGRSPATAPTDR